MGCASESSLQRFLEGTLSAPAAAALEDHLGSCDACRELLAEAAQALPDDEDAAVAAGIGDAAKPGVMPGPGVAAGDGPLQTVGRYQIEAPLGAGGMGVVYVARDTKLDRRVALKLLRTSVFRGLPEARAVVLREARAMAKLAHPNVLAVYDVGEVDETLFVAMELIEGGTLGTWLGSKAPRRTSAEVLEVFIAAARGLEAAHEAGLVHRDFKPDNVLLGKDGRVRVTDFGLALPAAAREAAAGTPSYMAPEQRRGEPADARADQYSFCVALHEGLTGARPASSVANAASRGGNAASRGGNAASPGGNGASTPAATVSADLPTPLRRLLERGLQADPASRFPSMAALRIALEQAQRGPRRRRLLLGSGAAIGVLLVLLGLVIQQRAELSQLRGRKQQLDARIAAILKSMAAETRPAELFALETELHALTGSAEAAGSALRAKGQPTGPPKDALDVQIADLLRRFGAETYAVPPVFKERLRHHIDRIVRAQGLPAARARMATLLPTLRRELAARGLPTELAYVCWTESRFDPQARSPSGSVGLWQFMASTARTYGLTVDDKVDERTDVEKSSRAAAAYLANLFADFGRDSFMLALASYNMGESQVRSVLRSLSVGPGGLTAAQRDFWHLYRLKLLPDETREYVPGVLAAAIVFEHPEEYLR